MVPVGGDVFEGEAELFALAGGERRDVQVDCIGDRARWLKDVQGTSSACTTWPSESLKLTWTMA